MRDYLDRPRTPAAMTRMADTLGLDLGVEYDAHIVTRRQLDRAVDRCTGCGDPDGCAMPEQGAFRPHARGLVSALERAA